MAEMLEAKHAMDPDALYSQVFFRQASGAFLRPGGLDLTLRSLSLCGLLRDGLAAETGTRVADVGCGTGAGLALIRDLGFAVTGVEPDPKLRAEALARLGPEADIREGWAEDLPLEDASRDALLCECVLSLSPRPAAALGEMRRVLRPGGFLLLSDLYLRGSRGSVSEKASCLRGAMDRDNLRQELDKAGFRVLVWEDHSRALRELAGRMLFNGSGAELAAWLGADCPGGGPCGPRGPARGLGYGLIVAGRAA